MAVWWTSIVGILIIGWILSEIFMDLFQPSGSGSLSGFIGRWLFQISKSVPSTMRVSGPLAIVVVISCWALLLAAGFALVYWARFPQGFSVPEQESYDAFRRFWTVLYFSLSSLTTLGSGALAPAVVGYAL
ncbi:MAG TPA: hypothetical protein VFA65_09910 [Bryobacteraceae bacterium]|nr:hypothetical protein [Bryobacteraceae bacterium]